MLVDWPFLLLAVFLLWLPRQWMRLGTAFFRKRKRRGERANANQPWNAREPGDPRVSFRREFARGRNYIDLLRAAAGSLLLDGGLGVQASLRVGADAAPGVGRQILALQAAIFLLGLLIQAVRFEKGRLTFYPPIFYLAGLTVGLCDLRGAVFAFALMWAVNAALGNAQAFLTIYAMLVMLFGYFFSQQGRVSVILAGVLCLLPVLLSLLSRRPLVVMSRKAAS
jgi:hypothetical protein